MIKKLLDFYVKLSPREKKILYGTLFVISLFLVERLIIHPIAEKLVSLDKSILDQKIAVKKSMHVLLQKEKITRDAKDYASYSVESKDPEEEMTSLLKEIEALANNSSVTLSYVKPVSTKDSGNAKKYFASLECEAPMEELVGFFYSIESSTKLLKIEKYTIQPKSKDSSLARCTATVSKTVFS